MNVLFVCEDNCALSLMAESILDSVAQKRFGAYSAGCVPGAAAHPYVLELLATRNMRAHGLCPKGLDVFRTPAAPRMDFVITLCDIAAAEDFSAWPGAPFVAHWSVQGEDDGTRGEAAQRDNFWTLLRRIKIFASLRQGKLNRRVLQQRALMLDASHL